VAAIVHVCVLLDTILSRSAINYQRVKIAYKTSVIQYFFFFALILNLKFKKSSEHSIRKIIRCDQLKNKSSRRVIYGYPCYSIGSKANSIYFLNDRSVFSKYSM
jgi:hypothetical protein